LKEASQFGAVWRRLFGRGANNQEVPAMKGIIAIVIAASLFAIPAAAQDASKGKSSTAPGQTGVTPGHEKPEQSGAKNFAPGRQPVDAKDAAPGAGQRKKK
jgi:hypothetical protein